MRLVILCALALGGCQSFIDRRAAETTLRVLRASGQAATRQADIELARAALPGGILQLEAFAIAYPDERGFRELHAETLCTYAVAFVFDDWEDASLAGRTDEAARIAARLRGLLASCIDANLALLGDPPAWRTARANGGTALVDRIAAAPRADVPALRWIATADAVSIAIAPSPLAALDKLLPTVAALRRCVELAPLAHDADAELLLGTLESAAGPLLGGAGGGAARFEAARHALGDGGLIVDVMQARAAASRSDRERLLQRALAADLARWPERRLANELALRKARRYLGSSL